MHAPALEHGDGWLSLGWEGARLALHARVEGIAQPVADEVNGQHRDYDGYSGRRPLPGIIL